MENAAQVQLLGGQQGKSLRQIEAHLVSEGADRARARTIVLSNAVIQNVLEIIEVLAHRGMMDQGLEVGACVPGGVRNPGNENPQDILVCRPEISTRASPRGTARPQSASRHENIGIWCVSYGIRRVLSP